jgi:hypothetical protein
MTMVLLALWLTFLYVGGVSSLQSSGSSLARTQWKLRLDVGLQPGTWMPKRFPGWAESGARLGLDLQVEFTNVPCSTGEALVGPRAETFELAVTSPVSTFVSERGEEQVEFTGGGWCVQQPTGAIRNASGSSVKPEGLLRFWVDCPTGAKRRDVEIFPGTRLFFTTGVWEDPRSVQVQDAEYRKVLEDIETLTEKTRENRERAEGQNVLQKIGTFRNMVSDSKDFELLKDLKDKCERELPPAGASVAENGVQMAPTGSLVVKGNKISDWLPGSEYLILGTFSTTSAPVVVEASSLGD